MKKLKLKSFSDAGHGWLAVKRSLLKELGIEKAISSYSYQKGETVYLEEDSDLSKFVQAFELKHNVKVETSLDKCEFFDIKHTNSDRSAIRNYAAYSPDRITPEVGLRVSLYGKNYEIVGKNGSKFIVKNEMGQLFTLRKTQEDELKPAIDATQTQVEA